MIEVMVDAIPMVAGHTEYVAKAWESESEKEPSAKLSDKASMRGLMLKLKEKSEEKGWGSGDLHIWGEFEERVLTEDDWLAWGTPIFKLKPAAASALK